MPTQDPHDTSNETGFAYITRADITAAAVYIDGRRWTKVGAVDNPLTGQRAQLLEEVTRSPQPRGGRFAHTDITAAQWFQNQLARFSYKPGWQFEICGTHSAYPAILRISFPAEDTYNPGHQFTVGAQYVLWGVEPGDADAFTRAVLRHIRALEDHEAREWFKVDGNIFDNPHANDPR